MFQSSQNNQTFTLFSSDQKAEARICLQEGGRLKKLVLGDRSIIAEPQGMAYEDSFAAAILFPFANRIANGQYSFNSKSYQLSKNEKSRENAIHGLIYDKTFQVVDGHNNEESASVNLVYEEQNPPAGFPFPYTIGLSYQLFSGVLKLKLDITNTGNQAFPFTLGWHPYFKSTELDKSQLVFHPKQQVALDKNRIPTGRQAAETENPFFISDKNLDDCFILKDSVLAYQANGYQIKLKSSPFYPYLQIYTPPARDSIAIEPMTGIGDSFNNQTGLQTLQPGKSYQQIWQVTKE